MRMKKHKVPVLLLACTCGLICRTGLVRGAEPIPARDRTVILISLDGFPAYDLDDPKLPIPTLRELMKNGSSAKSMQPINPTWTWPNHTTMVTGVNARRPRVFFFYTIAVPAAL